MNRLARTLLLLGSCCVLGTGVAPAADTVYYDRAAFEAAVGPHVTYTFEPEQGFPAAPAEVTTVGPVQTWSVTVGSPAYIRPWPLDSGNQTLSGSYSTNVTSPLLLTFPPLQSAVAFDMYTNGNGGLFSVTYSDGSLASYLLPIDFFDVSFFGMVSDVSVIQIIIWCPGDGRSQRWKGIDNLTLPIPEPALLSPLLAATAVLASRIRPQRRAHA